MEGQRACITFTDFPLIVSAEEVDDCALATLTGTEGPAYRPIGATMLVKDGRIIAGSLSSGCVERDIAIHAMQCIELSEGRSIRYGAGSSYFDIRLPCGGALDVTIIPAPGPDVVAAVAAARETRQEIELSVSEAGLRIQADPEAKLYLRIIPDICFHVFGKGPEAATFAELTAAAGYKTLLASPDKETLKAVMGPGIFKQHLSQPERICDLGFDRFSAVVLFFHDHEWEPPILAKAAESDAFYIGAQGSLRARSIRDISLARLGIDAEKIAAMKGPAGLFLGARDARSLAISVLSEVIFESRQLRQEILSG